jgi:hypothetical protein
MLSVYQIRETLETISFLIQHENLNLFDLNELFYLIEIRFKKDFETLNLMFVLFFKLSCSKKYWKKQNFPNLSSLLEDHKYYFERARFSLLLSFFIYFQNPKSSSSLKPIWFLLHYRGLSYTGFHILHELGIGPSIRSLNKYFESLYSLVGYSSQESCVWWADNLRRRLKGRVSSECREDWTVIARTVVSDPIPLLDKPASGHIFYPRNLLMVQNLISQSFDQEINIHGSTYHESNEFSIPLRSKESAKFKFVEEDILPVSCGSLKGTIELLKYFSEKVFTKTTYTVATFDYDLYWRVHKLYYTTSIRGSFPEQRQKLILIMGPWHIFKTFCNAVWDYFSPLIFAPMWLEIFNTRVPENPPLKDQLVFFISIANCTRRKTKWKPKNNCLAESTACLIYELIPLVFIMDNFNLCFINIYLFEN